MNEGIEKLAKAIGQDPESLLAALNDAELGLVWDPEDVMPEEILAVYRTGIRNNKDSPVRYWWTLKPTNKGKHTNRSTGEVFKWKT